MICSVFKETFTCLAEAEQALDKPLTYCLESLHSASFKCAIIWHSAILFHYRTLIYISPIVFATKSPAAVSLKSVNVINNLGYSEAMTQR